MCCSQLNLETIQHLFTEVIFIPILQRQKQRGCVVNSRPNRLISNLLLSFYLTTFHRKDSPGEQMAQG